MEYRELGRSGIRVSEVGFGAWTLGTDWWGTISEERAKDLVNCALEEGINFFDTADAYGDGRSERILGECLRGRRDKVIIATKFGYDIYRPYNRERHEERPQDFSPDFIRRALKASLERLKTDYVDLYQLHNPRLEVIRADATFEVLEELRRDGFIRCYGVALGPAIGWREEGLAAIRERRVASVQTVFNLLEQDPGRELCRVAEEHGSSLLARVPHASGLLDGTLDEGVLSDKRYHRSYRDKEWLIVGREKVKRLSFLLEPRRCTMGQVAIKFLLSYSGVASVLPTITSLEKLREFARASDGEYLSPEELAKIDELYSNDFYLKREAEG